MISYSYSCGTCDILRAEDLRKLDKLIQLSKEKGATYFGIGIYDSNVCEHLGTGTPLKSLEDRMSIMEQIIGVDFVFPIHTLDKKVLSSTAEKCFKEYMQNKKKNANSTAKKYSIVYAPGTYDLFHAGHLENLSIAAQNGEKLIVGVKSDDLVQAHKNKRPVMSAEERMEILRHFKFVHDVYTYYTRDLHIAKDWIEAKYGSLDPVFLGSDLKNDFKDCKDINIVFTDRPPEVMATRSTTAYRKGYRTLKNIPTSGNGVLFGHIDTSSCEEKIQPKNPEIGHIDEGCEIE